MLNFTAPSINYSVNHPFAGIINTISLVLPDWFGNMSVIHVVQFKFKPGTDENAMRVVLYILTFNAFFAFEQS